MSEKNRCISQESLCLKNPCTRAFLEFSIASVVVLLISAVATATIAFLVKLSFLKDSIFKRELLKKLIFIVGISTPLSFLSGILSIIFFETLRCCYTSKNKENNQKAAKPRKGSFKRVNSYEVIPSYFKNSFFKMDNEIPLVILDNPDDFKNPEERKNLLCQHDIDIIDFNPSNIYEAILHGFCQNNGYDLNSALTKAHEKKILSIYFKNDVIYLKFEEEKAHEDLIRGLKETFEEINDSYFQDSRYFQKNKNPKYTKINFQNNFNNSKIDISILENPNDFENIKSTDKILCRHTKIKDSFYFYNIYEAILHVFCKNNNHDLQAVLKMICKEKDILSIYINNSDFDDIIYLKFQGSHNHIIETLKETFELIEKNTKALEKFL